MHAVEVFPDRQRLIQAAAEHMARLASEAATKNESFTVVLPGGSTP
jgi:6-phosphogluconolactonase/glucosamine-6-phosphate isomerase/deaminase